MDKLPELEQRIKERIRQAKNNIHPSHIPIYTETLNIEIETLQWALNEIAVLRNSLALKSVSENSLGSRLWAYYSLRV